MSRIRIVTDTTASLPVGWAAAHHVAVVPQVVLFGEQSYLEDVEISYADYVRRLKANGEKAHTSQPPPGEFVKAYRQQLAAADTLLSIHPSTEISGTVRSAQTARQTEFPSADIRILDTRTVAGDLGTMVQLAEGWAVSGVSADEIMSRLQALIPRSRTYFLVATLEYLRRGGRIGGAAALVGSVLQVKPILEIKNGRVEPLEKVRTHALALEHLKKLVAEQCPRTPEAHVCVMHADDEPEARRLAEDLQALLGTTEIPLYSVGAAITTHAGPGTVAVGFFVLG
jgi:DegV family protein with EDD domain